MAWALEKSRESKQRMQSRVGTQGFLCYRQQVTAAEILFGSAPFQVHPHHMKAPLHGQRSRCVHSHAFCGSEVMQEDILMIFASTLLKKMMAAWVHEVLHYSSSQDFVQIWLPLGAKHPHAF